MCHFFALRRWWRHQPSQADAVQTNLRYINGPIRFARLIIYGDDGAIDVQLVGDIGVREIIDGSLERMHEIRIFVVRRIGGYICVAAKGIAAILFMVDIELEMINHQLRRYELAEYHANRAEPYPDRGKIGDGRAVCAGYMNGIGMQGNGVAVAVPGQHGVGDGGVGVRYHLLDSGFDIGGEHGRAHGAIIEPPDEKQAQHHHNANKRGKDFAE